VKRSSLLKHLRQHGCYLKREGAEHSLWCNPANGAVEAVPGHQEIANKLARKICRNLAVPDVVRP
jgi:predicted RNA binding protein YcfA (HicA-like mRNA interferase family)